MNVVFQTVISGVIVFVIGQMIQNFILKPIQAYKKIIGKIDGDLIFYANVITNNMASIRDDECRHSLRKLSSDLSAI